MIKRLLIVLFCLVLVLAGLAGFLLFSEKGLQVGVAMLGKATNGRVQIRGSRGKLLGSWQLTDISIQSEAADIRIAELSCAWQPEALLEARFHAADISAAGVEVIVKTQSSDAEPKHSFIPPEVALPFPFLIGHLQVQRARVADPGGKELFFVDSFSARLSGTEDRLNFSDVQLQSPHLNGSADGHLSMSGEWPLQVDSVFQTAVAGCSEFQGSATISETLVHPGFLLQLSRPEKVTLQGSVADLFDDLSYQLEISGSAVALDKFCGHWPEAVVDLDLKTSGDLDEARGAARSTLLLEGYPAFSTEFGFTVNKETLTVVDGTLAYGSNQVAVSGGLNFMDELSWDAVVTAESFAVSDLLPVPETLVDARLAVQGRRVADGVSYSATLEDVTVSLKEQNLQIVGSMSVTGDQRGLAVTASTFEIGDGRVEIDGALNFIDELSWEAVIKAESFAVSDLLPVPETLVDARLDVQGRLAADGVIYAATIEDVAVSLLEQDLQIGGSLSLTGDQRGLEITTSAFDVGDGKVEIDGALNWVDQFGWQGNVYLDSFDPSEIDSLPAGSISGSFSSSGRIGAADLYLVTQIESLSGELSGYELSGGGSLVYQDQVLTVSDLNLTNGNNRLYVEGTVAERFDLDFQINGAELERIFPQLRGRIEIAGELSGPRDKPVAELRVDGAGLSYQDYSAGAVKGDGSIAFVEREITAKLRLEQVKGGGLAVERADMTVAGSTGDHRLKGDVRLADRRVQADVTGSLVDNVWNGRIDELVFQDNRFGTWTQKGSTKLQAGPGAAKFDRTCFASAPNFACVEASWNQDKSWLLAADELKFDLSSLNRWGLLEQKISGTVAASLQASGKDMTVAAAAGNAELGELKIDLGPNEYYNEFKWFDTKVVFSAEAGDFSTRFSTRFVDDSTISGSVSVPWAGDFSSRLAGLPVRGNLDVDIKDLSWLRVLTSDFLIPQGSLSGELKVEGPADSLAASGNIILRGGQLGMPFLGVDLTGVNGTIAADGRQLLLEVDSIAGTGKLHSSGHFQFGPETWQGGFTFSGVDCELLNRRAIQAVADPQLELKLGPDGGSLTGKVAVSKALIEVEKIDRSASESSDVVFIDEVEKTSQWPFHYDIDVALGDQIEVTGSGLSARLGGLLKVVSSPDGTTAGRGFLDIIDGSYEVYGSPLQINRGRLTFDGGPVDNPSLDIQASKLIKESRFGYEGVEAGVKITGSASDYEMELYSVPTMSDNDILAYILLDKPFTTEGDNGTKGLVSSAAKVLGLGKGSDLLTDVSSMLPVDDIRVEGGIDTRDTALVVGKNLSEDLSVSYDYNLFKNAGSFRVRYEFGKGFSVESRNSLESSGVELLYSFER